LELSRGTRFRTRGERSVASKCTAHDAGDATTLPASPPFCAEPCCAPPAYDLRPRTCDEPTRLEAASVYPRDSPAGHPSGSWSPSVWDARRGDLLAGGLALDDVAERVLVASGNGPTTAEREELNELRRENRQLRLESVRDPEPSSAAPLPAPTAPPFVVLQLVRREIRAHSRNGQVPDPHQLIADPPGRLVPLKTPGAATT
jgi:hypothetical protein